MQDGAVGSVQWSVGLGSCALNTVSLNEDMDGDSSQTRLQLKMQFSSNLRVFTA
jgi:hypothetical protein